MSNVTEPVVLIIRDGWGENHNPAEDGVNALKLARIDFSNSLSKNYPRTEIAASGLPVGLPDGVMGNSEVGHQNIGAGRIVDQEIVRIDKAITDGSFGKNKVIVGAFDNVKKHRSKLHLFGLCSDGGVHSILRHLYAILRCAKNSGLERVYIHFFSDGRDTPQKSGIDFLSKIESKCAEVGVGKVATVIGRFFAMDRDKRWNRVKQAYDCLTGTGECKTAASAQLAIRSYYDSPTDGAMVGDEFIPPTRIISGTGEFEGKIEDDDSVIFFNFRGDRPRELTHAFVDEHFSEFAREKKLSLYYAIFTEYEADLVQNIVFQRPAKMKNILGEYVSSLGLRQFRCAETEKYAHVTFFFNDYREEAFPGEDRSLIPSPRDIETYDKKPEMSAFLVKDAVREAILSKKYSLIVVNFANPDMVGHTGNLQAAIKAAEVVDACVEEILSCLNAVNGSALVTADHGNLECMRDIKTGQLHTQHTTNPVEVVLYGAKVGSLKLREGGYLADIAPTLLEMMGLKQPKEMAGVSLIAH
ncbi:MAG: 2,3-bisphosphoglycerate-independent phosphoglycerate mutase [Puniceicoccales bacterium]|jgi:2,3-bisphosphoglycerate-independent phosphoglycerate mutase|nr:2,3-bisphosphoglycerate-independent phosphoglycerate mutase [Puniceicoccales bacterium]